jgi:histidine triad (HIT) family protein
MPARSCLFCRIASGEAVADVVYSDGGVIAFRDIRPVAPVHVLIVPARHMASLHELQGSDAGILDRMTSVAREIATREGVDSSGYRLVINTGMDAGQSVFHLHMHLIGGRRMGWPPG